MKIHGYLTFVVCIIASAVAGCNRAQPPFSYDANLATGNAQRTECQGNMKNIALAIIQYSQRNSDTLPDLSTPDTLKAAVQAFTSAGSQNIFACTSTSQPILTNASLSRKNLYSIANPGEVILIYDAENSHFDGRNVGFVDGHIKWYKEEAFQQMKAASGIS